jgi:hypothetical protein
MHFYICKEENGLKIHVTVFRRSVTYIYSISLLVLAHQKLYGHHICVTTTTTIKSDLYDITPIGTL